MALRRMYLTTSCPLREYQHLSVLDQTSEERCPGALVLVASVVGHSQEQTQRGSDGVLLETPNANHERKA